MPQQPALPTTPLQVGFLTVMHEASGFLGGYLVTNLWGRPLEFRLSSAVQPNRVQQILYGEALEPYICADLIGKTLIDKAGVPVQVVFTDRELVLDLRHKLDVPVLWMAPADAAGSVWSDDSVVSPPSAGRARCMSSTLSARRGGSAEHARAVGSRRRPGRAVHAHPRGDRRSPQDGRDQSLGSGNHGFGRSGRARLCPPGASPSPHWPNPSIKSFSTRRKATATNGPRTSPTLCPSTKRLVLTVVGQAALPVPWVWRTGKAACPTTVIANRYTAKSFRLLLNHSARSCSHTIVVNSFPWCPQAKGPG